MHSHNQRTKDGVLKGVAIMRVQQLCWSTVSESQEWRSGLVQDRPDATVSLIRGGVIPRTMFWHASGSSNSCLPT
eukprot:2514969-Pyramimonas_sp.AAC.1